MPPRIPPITKALLLSNALVLLLQHLLNDLVFAPFMLWPLGEYPIGYVDGALVSVGFLPWQLLTYGFLHGGPSHMLFNMLALWMFGAQLERDWGARSYAFYYFVCVIGAGLVQLLVVTWGVSQGAQPYPTVGASGGVFGLLLAFGMMYPNLRMVLLFPPIPMRARTMVIGYGVFELIMGVTGTLSGIAHFAHLGGMFFGFLLIQYWRGRWPFERSRGG